MIKRANETHAWLLASISWDQGKGSFVSIRGRFANVTFHLSLLQATVQEQYVGMGIKLTCYHNQLHTCKQYVSRVHVMKEGNR
jgi:hypothetical protein